MLGLILIGYGLTSPAITGMATGTTTATVTSGTSISMVTSTVALGDMAINTWNDTSDGVPAGFKVRNDGNVNLNISLNSSDDLWDTAANPTANYTAKCTNNTAEWNCTAGSAITYTNVPTAVTVFIYNMSFDTTVDEAVVDINVTVPSAETPGAKSSVITFTGSAAA